MFTIEQNKALCKKFPYLTPRNVGTGEINEDYDYSYIEGFHGPWERLFLLYCMHIREPLIEAEYLNSYYFMQLKEKYGSMRIYDCAAPESVNKFNSIYEALSVRICCECGAPATHETLGWIAFKCEECARKSRYKTEDIGVPSMELKIHGYRNGQDYEKVYDLNPYFEEYMRCREMTDEEFFEYIMK